MAQLRVALATSRAFASLADDDLPVLAPLADLGVIVEPAVWDDPAIAWHAYDLVVVRSTWDYVERRADFLAWAARVPRLANPADLLTWNTDKRYLRELGAAGVPVVETTWFEPDRDDDLAPLPWEGTYVVKPAISASARDTHRHDLGDRGGRSAARAHIARLVRAGRTAMLQPYLDAVDTNGETSLLFMAGAFSHAARKAAVLAAGGGEVAPGGEEISAREPRQAELDVADRALAAVPGGPERLLYARVDLIDGPDGMPRLLELELTEPSLFLRVEAGAPQRFAAAIASWARDAAAGT